jgi:hypothetical protein
LSGITLKSFGITFAGYTGFIAAPFMGLAYSGLMLSESKKRAFLKGMANYVTAFALFAITTLIIGTLVVALISFFDPETYNNLRPSNNR